MIINSKVKLNIVDVLVIIIIFLSIAGVGYKFSKSKTISPFNKPDKLVIKLYSEEVPEYVVRAVKLNDLVIDFDTSSVFGHVTKVEIGPSAIYTSDDKGEIKKSSKPDYASAHITVDGSGFYKNGITESGVSIGNVDYFVGRTITFKVGNSIMYGRIYDLKKVE